MNKEFPSGNIYIRKNPLPNVGDGVDGDVHNFDHTTIVFKGAVRVTATHPNGVVETNEYVAPSFFLVPKATTHTIKALVPDTEFWCVYSHRAPNGDVVQEPNGWGAAYV